MTSKKNMYGTNMMEHVNISSVFTNLNLSPVQCRLMARLLAMTLAVTGSNGDCWSNGSWEECCTVPRKHCWNRRHQLLGFANFGSFFFSQLLEDLFVSSWRFRTQTRPSTRLFNSEHDSSDQKKVGSGPDCYRWCSDGRGDGGDFSKVPPSGQSSCFPT